MSATCVLTVFRSSARVNSLNSLSILHLVSSKCSSNQSVSDFKCLIALLLMSNDDNFAEFVKSAVCTSGSVTCVTHLCECDVVGGHASRAVWSFELCDQYLDMLWS